MEGFQPVDFPYRPPYLDGSCYFAGPKDRSIAEEFNQSYQEGILEVSIDWSTYQRDFRPLEHRYDEKDGCERIEIVVPQSLFPMLNRLSPQATVKSMDNSTWEQTKSKYQLGQFVQGKVEFQAAFGVFLELEDSSVKGLIKIPDFLDEGTMSEAILDSIAAEQGTVDLTESQKQELDRRVEDLEANPDNLLSWEEVKAAIKVRK